MCVLLVKIRPVHELDYKHFINRGSGSPHDYRASVHFSVQTLLQDNSEKLLCTHHSMYIYIYITAEDIGSDLSGLYLLHSTLPPLNKDYVKCNNIFQYLLELFISFPLKQVIIVDGTVSCVAYFDHFYNTKGSQVSSYISYICLKLDNICIFQQNNNNFFLLLKIICNLRVIKIYNIPQFPNLGLESNEDCSKI